MHRLESLGLQNAGSPQSWGADAALIRVIKLAGAHFKTGVHPFGFYSGHDLSAYNAHELGRLVVRTRALVADYIVGARDAIGSGELLGENLHRLAAQLTGRNHSRRDQLCGLVRDRNIHGWRRSELLHYFFEFHIKIPCSF